MITRYALVVWASMLVTAAQAAAEPQGKAKSPQAAATGEDEKKEPLPKGTAKEWHTARQQGFQLVRFVVTALEKNDAKEFPGIAAWVADYQAAVKEIDPDVDPATWPALDVDALVTHNPRYWQAYFEVAPGDPGLAMLHGGLLHLGGESARGSYVAMAFQQRPGIPQPIDRALNVLIAQADLASKQANATVMQGIERFDQGQYDAALKLHEEALRLNPQFGFAHYEWALTARQRDWSKAGIKPAGKLAVNDKALTMSPAAAAAFGRARRHDPFQWRAYQGDDPAVIDSFMALTKQGLPNFELLKKSRPDRLEDEPLIQLADGCQGSRNDELALVFRSAVIARRGRYTPADHPFIAQSLRRMAPGKVTEETLAKLAAPAFKARQIIAVERP